MELAKATPCKRAVQTRRLEGVGLNSHGAVILRNSNLDSCRLAPSPQSGNIRMTTCRHAVERGEVVATVGEDEVSLISLLGSAGVSQLDAETQTMATALQFFRAMATGLAGDFGSTGTCRGFCAELDSELDRQLGGTFAGGHSWSTQLQEASGLALEAAGADLARLEAAAVADGKSRACSLLGALGRPYECSHLLLAASAEVSSIRDVLAGLLSPFEWLQATVLRLVDSHHLRDVEAEEMTKAFAVVAAIPEGVPPSQPHGAAELEPEPEIGADV